MHHAKQEASPRRKPIIIAVIVIAAVVLGVWAVKAIGASPDDGPSSPAQASGDLWTLTTDAVDMEAIALADVPAVIDFGSDSCVPCKQMAPVLEETNEQMQGRAIVKFVDVWENPDAAQGFPIQVIPTQVLMLPGGAPFVPTENFPAGLNLEFQTYQDADGNHVFTVHQGALTQAQMNAILEDMGA